MKNILIPTDFSSNSWNSVVYALDFFKHSSCNFYILHVSQNSVINEMEHEDLEKLRSITSDSNLNDLRKFIIDIQKISTNKKHRFFPVFENRFLIDSIRNQVARKKIDYIVMGTKGASDLKEDNVGSNTGEVITKVKCPILVIPENAHFEKVEKIAFPTDFYMSFTPKVINTLVQIMDLQKSSLEILNVKKDHLALTAGQEENKEYLDAFLEDRSHDFHTLSMVKIEVGLQDFVDSEEINLIAMVAKNLNFIQRLFFEQMTEQLSYHTKTPFLVLHE